MPTSKLYHLTDEDHVDFAVWFCANHDIPEGVEPFEVGSDGAYVWELTRAGMVEWMGMRCSKELEENFEHLSPCWNLGEDGRTPTPTQAFVGWANWMVQIENRRVGWDIDRANNVEVSTAFLGCLGSIYIGKPMFYQTMIFGGPLNGYERRYSTWEEAEVGHALACERAGIQRKTENK